MKRMIVLVALSILIAGCVMVPRSQYVVRESTSDKTLVEYDYVGVTTPLYVSGYTVPFYPRYFVSCDCIIPIAFYGGYWINIHGVRIVPPPRFVHPPLHAHNRFHGTVRKHPDFYRRVPHPK